MMLIDTSVVIDMFRDKSGRAGQNWRTLTRRRDYALPRFTQLEVLAGARSDDEWDVLENYLDGQTFVDPGPDAWVEGGRTYFELRRKGMTVRSMTDCMIAQLAIDQRLTLIHNDRDFETISKLRPELKHRRVKLAE